ncbi:TAXI family TRAP transporter solute-binding subunit [Vibrio sp. S11_S32]|uniref:TAXI family TRAP transporter solute-binding subunit n=1 Tax=Vibrio sp. S11_S32 TaxID=2720225 RepID=UPI001681A37B|nr:TAXI family TRAP transporter solute-binding subunit [Vibrio sp. S11_S32]MBD1575249.1 TAXI family TRAP transporter solute-binding subunit [Vibrio sp. S11_S32]
MISPDSPLRFCWLWLASALLVISSALHAQENTSITIGSGSVSGVYYPAGASICKLINKGRKQHHIRCSVESSNGSIDNLTQLQAQDIDIAITQADWQYYAYHGSGPFASAGAYKEQRALFSLYNEPFNLLVRSDSAIHGLPNLLNKRVSLGGNGSGDRATMNILMAQSKWDDDSFASTQALAGSHRAKALCDNQIDAFVAFLGHPNASIKEATQTCKAQLIPVVGKGVDNIVKRSAFYTYTTIPGGIYPNNPDSIKTFGVLSTVVTSTELPDETAYQITKAVFENFEIFKRLHPAFAHLKKQNMVKDGISVPLHPGAIRYYKEVGLL